jgi:hypothetical protein
MQPLAVANRQFEDAVVRYEDKDIAGGIEDSRADFAMLEVFLHTVPRLRVERVIQIAGDVVPDMLAL